MSITTTVQDLSKRVNPQGVDLASATIKIALFTSSLSITSASTLYSGLSNEVASGGGYTTGGNTIASLAWSGTTSPKITGTIPSWTSASFTFRFAVIYDNATSKIMEYVDMGADQTVVAGTLALAFDTNGMLLVTSS